MEAWVKSLMEGVDVSDLIKRHIESMQLEVPLRQAIVQRVQATPIDPHVQHAVQTTLDLQSIANRLVENAVRKVPVDVQAKVAVERRVATLSMREYVEPLVQALHGQGIEIMKDLITPERIQTILESFPLEPVFMRENPRDMLQTIIRERVQGIACTDLLQYSIDERVASFPLEDYLRERAETHVKTLPINASLAQAVQQSKGVFLEELRTSVTPEFIAPAIEKAIAQKLTPELVQHALLKVMQPRITAELDAVAGLLRRDAQSMLQQEVAKVPITEIVREEVRQAIRPHIEKFEYAETLDRVILEHAHLEERIQSQLAPLLSVLLTESHKKIEDRVLSFPLDPVIDNRITALINPTVMEAKMEDMLRGLEPRKQLEQSTRRILADLVDRSRIEDTIQRIAAGFDLRGMVKERIEMQSAPAVAPSSVGLFIKTCARDGPKLVRCLKSIQAFAEGFAGLCIVTDADDTNTYDGFVTRFPVSVRKTACPAQTKTTCPHGPGFLWMQQTKLSWFSFCNFDVAVILDADAVLSGKLSPDMFTNANGLWKWQMGGWDTASQSYKAGQELLLPSEYSHIGCPVRPLTRSATLAFHKWIRDIHSMSWWDFLLNKTAYIWKQGLWGSHPYNAFGAFLTQVYKQDYEFTAYKQLPVQNVV